MNNVQKRILFLLRQVEDQRVTVNRERRRMALYNSELRSLLALEASRRPKVKA